MTSSSIQRPTTLDNFVVKESIKNIISISIESSKKQNIPLPHILINGAPGTGKTSLSQIIANEMGVKIHTIMAPSVKNEMMLVNKLVKVKANEIVFIDEIHSLPTAAFEMLYSVMEDGFIPVRIASTVINRPLRPLTIIGATNMPETLPSPLVDRFDVKIFLDLYTTNDIAKIIELNTQGMKSKGHTFTPNAITALAKVCRGVPRVALNYVSTISNYAISKDIDIIYDSDITDALTLIGIDSEGLNDVDRRIIMTLYETFSCQPVGIQTLASVIGQNEKILESQHEPFLITSGYILKTSRGRILTESGMEYAMMMDDIASEGVAT